MADFQKRAKQTRKQAAKRAKKTRKRAGGSAKATRKAVGKTSVRTRAQMFAAFGLAVGSAVALARVLKRGGDRGQRYSAEPDNLPNTPDRPATTTPPPAATAPPGAATAQTGADTGTTTETERARIEQTG
jgi:hypothetical protein